MEKKKLSKLIVEHLVSDDPDFKKAYEENPPIVEEKLEWQPGELIVGKLSKEDQFQLLSRYLNNICIYEKNLVHFLLRIDKMLFWLLEEEGIDVQAKFKEDAKRVADSIEQSIEAAKKQIKESVKN